METARKLAATALIAKIVADSFEAAHDRTYMPGIIGTKILTGIAEGLTLQQSYDRQFGDGAFERAMAELIPAVEKGVAELPAASAAIN